MKIYVIHLLLERIRVVSKSDYRQSMDSIWYMNYCSRRIELFTVLQHYLNTTQLMISNTQQEGRKLHRFWT